MAACTAERAAGRQPEQAVLFALGAIAHNSTAAFTPSGRRGASRGPAVAADAALDAAPHCRPSHPS